MKPNSDSWTFKILKRFVVSPLRKWFVYPLIRVYEQTIGLNNLPLYWYKDLNWGDALNPILIELLSERKARYTPYFFCDRFIAIGSILENANERTEVWGSGLIREGIKLTSRPKKIHAVRGPLTRATLLEDGIECPETFGDPALLLPFFFNPDVPKKYDVGIIPHYVDKNNPWVEMHRSDPSILVIDVQSYTWDFVKAVKSCRVILSSSLHGLICSDAYRVPNTWIQLSDNLIGGDFKFHDYYLSIGSGRPSPIINITNRELSDIVGTAKCHDIKLDLIQLINSCPFLSKNNKQRFNNLLPDANHV
jgi:pyruvyltransferase